MKLNKLAAVIATAGVIVGTGAIFAGKASAAPIADALATFNPYSVASNCMMAQANPNAVDYISQGTAVSGAENSLKSAPVSIDFDCNSGEVIFTTDESGLSFNSSGTAPGNLASPQSLVTYDDNTKLLINGDTVTTDAEGNGTLTIISEWKPDLNSVDNELADGTYGGFVTVTLTPN